MNRIAGVKHTYNIKQDVLDELNNFFISVKVSQMDKTDPKVQKVLLFHPMPTAEEMDRLHQKINEAFRVYEREYRKY